MEGLMDVSDQVHHEFKRREPIGRDGTKVS
jgi:hypothetical protein